MRNMRVIEQIERMQCNVDIIQVLHVTYFEYTEFKVLTYKKGEDFSAFLNIVKHSVAQYKSNISSVHALSTEGRALSYDGTSWFYYDSNTETTQGPKNLFHKRLTQWVYL